MTFRFPHLSLSILRACLALQVAALGALCVLNFLDERLEWVSLQLMLSGQVPVDSGVYRFGLPALAYLLVIAFGVYATGIVFAGVKQRSLRHMLILTTIAGLGASLFWNWDRISWEGRRYRMGQRIPSLESVCHSLQENWPTDDQNHGVLGPIMAYPQWSPSTLILLTPKPIDDRFCIAAIDRSQAEVLRFELSSGYETIWLEHRTDSNLDQEFTNGIAQHYRRQYSISLTPHWYLVRYQ